MIRTILIIIGSISVPALFITLAFHFWGPLLKKMFGQMWAGTVLFFASFAAGIRTVVSQTIEKIVKGWRFSVGHVKTVSEIGIALIKWAARKVSGLTKTSAKSIGDSGQHVWKELRKVAQRPLTDSKPWWLIKKLNQTKPGRWALYSVPAVILAVILWNIPIKVNFSPGWQILSWTGIVLILFIGAGLIFVSVFLKTLGKKNLEEDLYKTAWKLANIILTAGVAFILIGSGWIVLIFFGNTALESVQSQWRTSTQQVAEHAQIFWIILVVLLVAGLSLLLWRFPIGFPTSRPLRRYFSIVLVTVAGLGLLHLFAWLFWPNEWQDWTEHWQLFWVLNLGVLTVIFLSLSGLKFGKSLASLLTLLIIAGTLYHVGQTPTGKQWLEKREKQRIVERPEKKLERLERWVSIGYPGRVPGLVEETDLPSTYTREIRNLRQNGDTLTYDIWSSYGRGRTSWVELTKIYLPEIGKERFVGKTYPTVDNSRPASIWLEKTEWGYVGEAKGELSDGKEVVVPIEMRRVQ